MVLQNLNLYLFLENFPLLVSSASAFKFFLFHNHPPFFYPIVQLCLLVWNSRKVDKTREKCVKIAVKLFLDKLLAKQFSSFHNHPVVRRPKIFDLSPSNNAYKIDLQRR